MKLMTKEISKQAKKQYNKGSDLEQNVVAKFFHPGSQWTWYLMNQDPQDEDYLWGIVKGFEVEMGSFSLKELETFKDKFGLTIERDLYFKPRKAKDVYNALLEGKHI